MSGKRWTEEETKYLLENYNSVTASDLKKIKEKLDFSISGIKNNAIKLGIYKEKEYNRPNEHQLQYIKNNYLDMSVEEISSLLNLNKNTVRSIALKMGIRRGKPGKWTKTELDILKLNYGKVSNKKIFSLLGGKRSHGAIQSKAHILGIGNKINYWTKEEDEFLIAHYQNAEKDFILKNLNNRTWISVIDRVKELPVNREIQPWTKYEDDVIIKNWKNLEDFELSELLKKRTKRSVKWRRQELGLFRNLGHSIGKTIESKNGDFCHSLDECRLINYIYDSGLTYKKDVPYSELIYGDDSMRTCDVCLYIDDNIYAIEYFGMFRKNPRSMIEKDYLVKMAYKYDSFIYNKKEKVKFIGIYPDDIEKRDAIKMKKIIDNLKENNYE